MSKKRQDQQETVGSRRLRALLRPHGAQTSLAQRTGIDPSYISRHKTGQMVPSIFDAAKLRAGTLGAVEAEDFLTDEQRADVARVGAEASHDGSLVPPREVVARRALRRARLLRQEVDILAEMGETTAQMHAVSLIDELEQIAKLSD